MSQEDAVTLLNEFVYSIDNLPGEVAFLLDEIGFKDDKVQETRHRLHSRDAAIQRHTKTSGLLTSNPKEAALVAKIRQDFSKASQLSEEKVRLAEKALRLLEKHVTRLDGEFERLRTLGYNFGEAEVAHAMSGAGNHHLPQLDLGGGRMNGLGGSAQKRKAGVQGAGMGGSQQPALSALGQSMQAYTQQQQQQGGAFAGIAGYGVGNAGQQGGYMGGQYNQAALSQQQQAQFLQQQQHLLQQQGAQAAQFGGYQGQGLSQSQGAGGARPHRLSRLSASFSAGMGAQSPGLAQSMNGQNPYNSAASASQPLLPSSTAAHMPPGSGGAQGMPGTPSQGATPGGPLNKRGRPSLAPQNSSGAAGTPSSSNVNAFTSAGPGNNKKRKKRILYSDEEDVDDGMSAQGGNDEFDFASGGEGLSGMMMDEDGELLMSNALDDVMASATASRGNAGAGVSTSGAGGRRAGGPGSGTKNPSSRQGTPVSGGPPNPSAPGTGRKAANRSQTAATARNVAASAAQQQAQAAAAAAAANKQDEEDDDEEEAEADAEGEEDWANEGDEGNGDDPTLYCFCHRVSYGNMIACDNPECKYEWFHWSCVNVSKQPDDDQKWYCPECRANMGLLPSTPATGGIANNLANSTNSSKGGAVGVGSQKAGPRSGGVLLGGGGAGAGPYAQLQQQQQQMVNQAMRSRRG